MIKDIPSCYQPSVEEVQRYIEQWNGLGNYVNQERALAYLFTELCPANERLEQILLKIAALNDFYSTNIFSVHTVAQHFMSINIDTRLQREDDTLVDDLSWVKATIKSSPHSFRILFSQVPVRYSEYSPFGCDWNVILPAVLVGLSGTACNWPIDPMRWYKQSSLSMKYKK